ncbi:hypothetical protein T31B1_13384 [Salinisphaera sp. T31B1]
MAINLGLDQACRAGWGAARCLQPGFTLFPPYGDGELLLCEVVSLVLCLSGILVSLMSYLHGRHTHVRVSVVFLLLFVVAFLGENNLMRDDLRPQFLMVLLVWLGIELLLRRAFWAIGLLLAGCAAGFAGTIGDASAQAALENLLQRDIGATVVGTIATTFGRAEEFLELSGWLLFFLAALAALDLRWPSVRTSSFVAMAVAAIMALAVGDSFLHIRDNEQFEAARKFGFFCAVAGVAIASAAAFRHYAHGEPINRAYCALFCLALYWIGLFTPATYTHEHSKTISSWTWILPLLATHYFMVTARNRHMSPSRASA